MKKLLYIILLLPLWVNAQTYGTIQKTSSTGTIRGSFGSLGLDTLTRVTGALVNGYILKYNSSTNKWYASPDGGMVGLSDSLAKKANRTFDNVASGAIANVKLANSTISGISLGSNLNGLSATNGTLTFSGTYNGSTARTIGLNLGNANTWTALQTFNNGVSIAGGGLTNAAGATLTGSGVANSLRSSNNAYTTEILNTGTGSNGFIGTESNGLIFAPSSGTTSFRILSGGSVQIPSLSASGDILAGSDNNGTVRRVNIGSGLSYNTGTNTLSATGGSSGSVTTSGLTAGRIVKATSASNIENSIITETTNNISIDGADGTNQLDLLSGGNNRLSFGYLSSLMQIYSRNSLPLRLGVGAATTGLTIASGDNAEFSANGVPLNISSANSNTYKIGLKDGATTRGFLGASSTNSFMAANSSGTANFYVDNSTNAATFTGAIGASNFSGSHSGTSSGTNTGDQDLSGYAPLASPTFTGTVSGITAAMVGAPSGSGTSSGTNTGDQNLTGYALLSGATFTGAIAGTTATFSGDVTANSDSTLKKNIKPLISISTALRNIGAYSYDWKSNDVHAIGLIAQEVQKYFPELVKKDDKGILSMNYQNFTSVLLQGWKELDERITKLEQK